MRVATPAPGERRQPRFRPGTACQLEHAVVTSRSGRVRARHRPNLRSLVPRRSNRRRRALTNPSVPIGRAWAAIHLVTTCAHVLCADGRAQIGRSGATRGVCWYASRTRLSPVMARPCAWHVSSFCALRRGQRVGRSIPLPAGAASRPCGVGASRSARHPFPGRRCYQAFAPPASVGVFGFWSRVARPVTRSAIAMPANVKKIRRPSASKFVGLGRSIAIRTAPAIAAV